MTTLDEAWNKMRGIPSPSIVPPRIPDPVPLFELTPELIEAATIEERDATIADLQKFGLLRLPFPTIAVRYPQEAIAKVLGWIEQANLRGIYLTQSFHSDGASLTVDRVYTCSEILPEHENKSYSKEEMAQRLRDGTAFERKVVMPGGISKQVFMEWPRKHAERVLDPSTMSISNGVIRDYQCLGVEALTVLLASLAARNVVKEERNNASVRRPEGGFKQVYVQGGVTYLSRTVVKPPRVEDTDEARAGAKLSKVVLVRGFIRNQVADTTIAQPPNTRITVVGSGRTGRREQWIAPYYRGVDHDFVPTARHYLVRP